eukprot:CCRYP_016804-RA/>CCRYP_016804-RA protein AED:0.21 eAED:0.21 QI:0/0/0/1/1/1/3/0/813
MDSLFSGPSLTTRHSSGSDTSSDSSMSLDNSTDFETACEDTAYFMGDDASISSYSIGSDDVTFNVSDMGPPPPGSLMNFWDKPFPWHHLHDCGSPPEDVKCSISVTTVTTEEGDSSSTMSDDSSGLWVQPNPDPCLSVRLISATSCMQLRSRGDLVDLGGNFNMCSDLSQLVNVEAILPFSIMMAAKEGTSTSQCTHGGDFPLPMVGGSTFYTPMFYNPHAMDSILSPEPICTTSHGFLHRWVQSGSVGDNHGKIEFYPNEKASLAHAEEATVPHAPFDHPPHTVNPKEKQIEADLWQARLGHCRDWQLKVIPYAIDGTPGKFYPHPFASYDHYNLARIHKHPATKGKHPSQATKKQQCFFMDFGFLRSSTFDYSQPDRTRDRVVESFDGYNSYLLIVDEFTKYIWVFLCISKDPPIDLINMHLDQFGSAAGGSIRCDQGRELAGCDDFVTAMAKRQYFVEPTGADSPDQNKGAEKWNDILGTTVRVLLYDSGLPATFCVDQTASRIFYALAAAEGLLVFGSDVSNAFGKAPPPKQGFYIRPDKAFCEWWMARGRGVIPEDFVIPVLAAMQGHPESPRLWEKHIDKILEMLHFVATVHEPCPYRGVVDSQHVIFKRQVDDFAVAMTSKHIANLIFDAIDNKLSMWIKRQGLLTLYKDIDILQSRWYIKLSMQTYVTKTLAPYFADWLEISTVPLPTPLGSSESFIRHLYEAVGNPDPKVQAELEKWMGLRYRKAIGELIWPMVTCCPDLSQAVVKCSQASTCPSETHFLAVKSIFRYLAATIDDGIYFWRVEPRMDVPDDPLPRIIVRLTISG